MNFVLKLFLLSSLLFLADFNPLQGSQQGSSANKAQDLWLATLQAQSNAEKLSQRVGDAEERALVAQASWADLIGGNEAVCKKAKEQALALCKQYLRLVKNFSQATDQFEALVKQLQATEQAEHPVQAKS